MTDYFSDEADDQFDIADFETLVGELSHAVVVFPEAPGSFAETGYFSLVPDLAKKTVLALDAKYQSKDSFISMGPAKKIANKSLYFPTLQISYEKPNFEEVVARIVRHSLHRNRVQLQITKYEEISSFFLFCLIHQCFEILSTATFADVVFMLRAIFGGVLSVPRVRQLASVLVGAKYLIRIGEFGHYYVNPSKKKLLKIREGKASLQSQILAELGTTYLSSDAEFLRILEGATNAH